MVDLWSIKAAVIVYTLNNLTNSADAPEVRIRADRIEKMMKKDGYSDGDIAEALIKTFGYPISLMNDNIKQPLLDYIKQREEAKITPIPEAQKQAPKEPLPSLSELNATVEDL